jgi:hypothetical protein
MVLVLPLAVVSAADLDIRGGVGEPTYRPASIRDLRSEYRLGLGEMTLDLRGVELPPGRTEVRVRLGMGEATVHLPDGACVTSTGHMGLGEFNSPGGDDEGFGVDIDHPADNPSGKPELILRTDVGVGHVQLDQFGSCA